MAFPLASWLNQPDYLGAMTRGATLALDAQKMAQEGKLAAAKLAADQAEASGRLGLGYAQVGAGQQEAAANLELSKTKLGMESANANNLNDYRTRENDLRSKGLDLKEVQDSIKHGTPFHVGNSLVKPNDKGGVDVLFNADASKMSPVDRLKYSDALRARRTAHATLAKPDLPEDEKAFWQKQAQDYDSIIKSIESKALPGTSTVAPPVSTTPPDTNAPLGWKPTPGGIWERPVTDQTDPLAIKPAAPKYLYNPTTGTFQPQK